MTPDERAKCVRRFAALMTTKLNHPRNVAKGGWKEDPPLRLLRMLEEEAWELRQELLRDEYDRKAIREEAADVANFAMFIADLFDDEQHEPIDSRYMESQNRK